MSSSSRSLDMTPSSDSLGVRWARRAVFARLEQLTGGELLLMEAGSRQLFGSPSDLVAELRVLDSRFYRALAVGGSLGAAEAYLDGWWESPDLTSLIRLMARNRSTVGRLEAGLARLSRLGASWFHARRPNSRPGSRRNIADHYDLGNEQLFANFLDPSMTYSAAIFDSPDVTLEEAQEAKLDRICRKLELGPEDHVLEIGTGWGSFAIHAASRYGCRVTTTTISEAQRREAGRRIVAAGLAGKITLLERDYRDLSGRFDKLVSIEMIEAVGHRHFDTFFAVCDRLLVPHGRAALQTITIADRNYESARRSVDFIQRYIFPGGALPSVTALTDAATRSSQLSLLHLEEIGLHYAETLRRWRERFEERWPQVHQAGFPERFRRLWRYYLCYCEGGFLERVIGDVQMIFAGPEFRSDTVRGDLP